MSNEIKKIIIKNPNPELIEAAFEFAKEAYKEKFRLSGENYIEHAKRVAFYLDRMGLDPTTIAFGLLHDAVDDMPVASQKTNLTEIEKKFGKEIAFLIEKISGLAKLRYSLEVNIKDGKIISKDKIENLRRMFLALAGDLRVALVELVSRLDGLNLLHYLPQDQQKLYALETLQVFVPVANRLGLGEIRRNLEDLSFSYLFPERYKWLENNIKSKYEEREKELKKFIPHLKKILVKERIKFSDIDYRAKSYWSTYKKLLKKDMDFDRVHDLMALRVVVQDIESCYKTLGIIHKYYKPLSEDIDDYVAKPKQNGYRSLHTTIFFEGEKISEIQIRTGQMHKEAEYGVCAHWSYKEKIDLKKNKGNFEWMEGASEFWKTFKIDFFKNQVFALTPKGDVIVLKNGSTAVDFAYAIHSEIGNHCELAKANGKIVSLSYVLENGDIVEIVINKKRKPSQDWLKFVKTNLAQSHIKKAVAHDNSIFNLPLPGFIKRKIAEISEIAKKKNEEKQRVKKEKPRQIYLAGQKGMLVNIAKCCSPEPGDKVQAYLTKHRSAVLHRISCKNFQKLAEKFPERVIEANWE